MYRHKKILIPTNRFNNFSENSHRSDSQQDLIQKAIQMSSLRIYRMASSPTIK